MYMNDLFRKFIIILIVTLSITYYKRLDSGISFKYIEAPAAVLPCDGAISSTFGYRSLYGRHRMHNGIDFAAPIGSPIYSVGSGKVIFAGYKGGYGKTVIIEHEDEVITLYAHNSKLFVKDGEYVQHGDIISKVGNTGHSTGPHLHYEVRVNDKPIDPIFIVALFNINKYMRKI